MGKIVKLKDSQLEIRKVQKKFMQWKINEKGVPFTAQGRNRTVTVESG